MTKIKRGASLLTLCLEDEGEGLGEEGCAEPSFLGSWHPDSPHTSCESPCGILCRSNLARRVSVPDRHFCRRKMRDLVGDSPDELVAHIAPA